MIKRVLYVFSFVVVSSILLNSCRNINSNILFETPKGDSFKFDSIPLEPKDDYRLGTGDRFNFIFGTNDGERIIFNQSGVKLEGVSNNTFQQNNLQNQYAISYLIRQDGTVNLPLIGVITAEGKTIIELEEYLKVLLSKNYLNPFVMIRLVNQRVIVFPGKGEAQVVYLQNTNTSLLEAIAMAGGIRDEGRANSIKLMRKTSNGREIYKIDLSTIEGLSAAEMIIQSNDYIYVDFKPRIASSLLTEVAPWLSIITTAVLTYSLLIP